MRKWILIVLLFAVIGGFLGLQSVKSNPDSGSIPVPKKVIPTVFQQQEEKIGLPKTLSIRSINVENVAIEHVGLTPEGRMGIPEDFRNAAWYNLGSKPGEVGNAAIAGHFDNPSGGPSIFWDLDKMEPGQEIIVTDENGKKLTFKVVSNETFKDASFPIDKVFGKTDKKMLNLITCAGSWDSGNRNYSDRVVVFSELSE